MAGGASSWRSLLYDSASDRMGLILALVGIGLAFLFYLTTPNKVIPFWVAAAIIIALLSLLFIALHALKQISQASPKVLPNLLAVLEGKPKGTPPILLLEPSELFGIDSVVSVYHKDIVNEFEILIGYGSVLTIQSDNKIQIQVDEWLPGNEDISEKVSQENGNILKGIIIRPNAPRSAGNYVTQEELIGVLEALRGSSKSDEGDIGDGAN